MKYLEDIRIGEKTELGAHTFTAEEIKSFAQRFDPQPFHVDEAAAARTHYGGLVASGWHTGSVCIRLIVQNRMREEETMRARGEPVGRTGPSPGFRDLKWLKPVCAGDTICERSHRRASGGEPARQGTRLRRQHRHQPGGRTGVLVRERAVRRSPPGMRMIRIDWKIMGSARVN